MLKIKIKEGGEYHIDFNKSSILVNGEIFDNWHFTNENGIIHLIINNLSYKIIVDQINYANKELILLINGNRIKTTVKDETDQLLEKLGLQQTNNDQIKTLAAPMPGLITNLDGWATGPWILKRAGMKEVSRVAP